MRRACAMTILVLLGCGAAEAQSATTTPGMGATSPLGMLGSSAAGGTGVPLGATEIDPGGLSPATACVPTDPSVLSIDPTTSASGTNSGSTFDGGGLAGTSATTSSCTAGTNISSTGMASPLSGSPSNLAGGTIPLGATELDGGGLSPMIAVPAPIVPTPGSTTACAGALAIGSDPTTTSMNLGLTPGC